MIWPFLVLLVLTVTCKFSFGQTGTRIAFNRDHFNKRLDGYELQLLSNISLHDCVKECMVTFQCKSINSHRSAAICELNWVDTGDVDTSALMPNGSWNFYEINLWPPELAGQCRVKTCPRAHGCSQYMSGPSCYQYVIPECVTVHNDEGGTIKNKNFPNGFPDSSCSWELNAPDGKIFVLGFVNVSLGNSTDCEHTYVTVYDGSNKTDPELGKVCGSTQVDQPFMSTSNTMLVTMDSRMSVSYGGFEARYELGCNETFVGARGTIDKSNSVFAFQKYCSWQFTVGSSYAVVLGFLSLTLGGISCEQGPLTIHDGRYSNDETIATTCSQSRIEASAVVSTGDTLLINISTDVLANGFSGKFYTALRADSLVGTVHSPNYPMPYYNDDTRYWYLSVPSGHFVVLTFTELELEPTTGCIFDRLTSDEKATLTGRVLKKSSNLLEYQGKSGVMKYFNVVAGKGDETFLIRSYQRHKYNMIREGLTYKFANVVEKGDSFWAVQSSTISIVPPVQCSAQPSLLPEEEPAVGKKRSIHEALQSPSKSTVCAKIVKVSPLAMKCEGSLPVRCLGLKDETGKAKVALFQDLAKQEYVENSVVELSGVYQKVWEGRQQLVASRLTECQILGGSDINVNVTDEDADFFNSDADFGAKEEGVKAEPLTISAIMEVAVYAACDYDGCHKKKMVSGVCPTCSGSSAAMTCRAKLEVQKDSGDESIVTLFQKDLETLFGVLTLSDTTDNVDLMVELCQKLPVKFSAIVRNNMLLNVKV